MATTRTPRNQPDDQSDDQPTNDPHPTEQLPVETAPISASTAASAGDTGLADDRIKKTSVFRRHPLATGITAGALAVVLISGLTAWGVGAAVASSLTASTSANPPAAAPTPGATSTPGTNGATTSGRVAFRATIDSIDGNTWSITTKRGKTVTITVDDATQYGTKKLTENASSFAAGDNVVIVATRNADGTPTATRIVNSDAIGAGGTGDSGSDSSNSTSADAGTDATGTSAGTSADAGTDATT